MTTGNLAPLSPEERELVGVTLAKYELPAGEQIILRNTVGFVNKTFIIEIGNRKFVLRQSSPRTSREHLEFEVEVLRYLEQEGYQPSPRVLPNKQGEYLTWQKGNSFMLQNFIRGEIRATWNNLEHFKGEVLRNFFRASADFTKASTGFKPSKKYSNLPVTHYTKNAGSLFNDLLQNLQDSAIKSFLISKKTALLRFAAVTQKEFEDRGWDTLPQQLVHFDIHPGNMHYEGDTVVGIFDFDWVRMDCRITDTANSIGQSCWAAGDTHSGVYIKEKIDEGLRVYREAYGPSEFELEEENQLIKTALKGYMIYQVLWAGEWYREQYPDTRGDWVVKMNVDACLLNDYDRLF